MLNTKHILHFSYTWKMLSDKRQKKKREKNKNSNDITLLLNMK